MGTSRELKTYNDISLNNNEFNLLLTHNGEVIKTEQSCTVEIPLEEKVKDNGIDLTLSRSTTSCQLPTIDISLPDKNCDDNKISMYNDVSSGVNDKISTNTTNGPIKFENLSIDILKILYDSRQFLNDNNHNKCFGLVVYDSSLKQINFYSRKDTLKTKILGSLNIDNILQEVRDLIPIISINNDTLQIEQEI